MQVLDGEFSEYTFRECSGNDSEFDEIAIFNSELHEKYSQWNMYNLQTTTEIYKTYGITSDDLPTGRHI